VAFASQFVSEPLGKDGGLAFTAGMLHDIGKVVMGEAFKLEYSKIINGEQLTGKVLLEQERIRFGMDHAEVGARLLERWKFSPNFVAAVRYHHDPLGAGNCAHFAAAIDLANALAHTFDDYGEGPAIFVVDSQAALQVLGIKSSDLLRYSDRIRENVDFVEAMCALRS
jgi:putative nucleotidyltransferase with HDIG domain